VLAALIAETHDKPVWWLVVATFSLAGIALLALGSLLEARKDRHAQLLLDLSRRWDEQQIAESEQASAKRTPSEKVALMKRAYADKPSEEAVKEWAVLLVIPNLCETLGALEAEGAISLGTLHRMWGTAIQNLWRQWEKPVKEIRETMKAPRAYAELERLAQELAAYAPQGWLARLGFSLLRKGRALKTAVLHPLTPP
jgi:hypothetical protein